MGDNKGYWKDNVSLVLKLLAIWFVVSFGAGILFVDYLNQFKVFGFPFGFWMAQQGAIYVFVVLIFVYVAKMSTLDKKYGVDEDGEASEGHD
jgi:putative solute:sodium symporter small subunit